MANKKYNILPPITNKVSETFPELDTILLQLLHNRGLITQKEIDEYLNPDWSRDIHNPYLFQDMNLAVERIYDAIAKKETIGVFGDYDADGVCAAVIIVATLKKLGAAVEVYLPHREREGYGLNNQAIDYLHQKGAKLIITGDCGITNVAQIDYARSLNIAVIVTDHHEAQKKLPEAYAIIHCGLAEETYPYKFLSGGGVAFKLVQGLLRYPGCPLSNLDSESWEKWLLDLVAISTVADMVPLCGESRTLTKYGLIVLKKTRRLGLSKLIDQAGLIKDKLDAQAISFQLAPRINAAGRLDHANSSYSLLMTDNPIEAEELARSLNLTNAERQRITEEIFNAATEQIGLVGPEQYSVHAFNPNWPLGLVGLVAGKLAQEYNRPAIVICQSSERLAGSGRGIEQLDLMAVLNNCSDLLINFGGHKGAVGFSLTADNLDGFLQRFNSTCAEFLRDKDLTPLLNIDADLKLNQLNLNIVETVKQLEPFGMANPKPRFISTALTILAALPVGAAQQHLRLVARDANGEVRKFIYFNPSSDHSLTLTPGCQIDIVYEVGLNEWGGNSELELKVVDIRQHYDNF